MTVAKDTPSVAVAAVIEKHVPALGNQCEQRAQEPRQKPVLGHDGLNVFFAISVSPPRRLKRAPDAKEHKQIEEAYREEEAGRDQCPDQAAYVLEIFERILDPGGEKTNQRTGDYHNGGMAKCKPEPHRHRALALLHQLARGIVDGGYMVRVDGVTKTQHPSKQCGSKKHRLIAENAPGPTPCQHINQPKAKVE
jgi:hypothetical protein